MSKTIYLKYSNERSRELSIITRIMRDEEGKKYILKCAAFPEAIEHIKKIEKNYRLLSDTYKESEKVTINKCKLNDDNSICLEYIDGVTLEGYIDSLVHNGRLKDAICEIKKYIDEIKRYNTKDLFRKSEEFVKVFGDVSGFENSYSGKVNDIDRVLSNVILKNDKYVFVDFEWTFNFQIPIEYILFRIIHYYVNTNNERSVLIDEGIYELIGLDDKQLGVCLEMEEHFQKYVEGNVVSLGRIHNDLVKKSYHINDMMNLLHKNEKKEEVIIYFDEGEGFSEEKSKKYLSNNENLEYSVEVVFDKKYKKLRVDISEEYAIIKMKSIMINSQELLNSNILCTNGYILGNNTWAFLEGDSNFFIEKEIKSGDVLTIRYSIECMDDRDLATIIKKCLLEKDNSYGLLTSELNENKNELAEKKNEIERLNNLVEELLNSFSWKITKPIRKIGAFLKNRRKQ